jgi:putative sigma-54 modulation protein
MKIELIGKGIEISEDIRSFTEHGLSKLERHLKEMGEGEVEAVVTFTVEKHRERHRVDIDLYLKTPGGGALHAWEESNDTFMSLEFTLDDIDKQLNRLKERRIEVRKDIAREKAKRRNEEPPVREAGLVSDEKLSLEKPLTQEEALMSLQDEGRFFLVFRNKDSGDLNVIYRKKSGKYGLITP